HPACPGGSMTDGQKPIQSMGRPPRGLSLVVLHKSESPHDSRRFCRGTDWQFSFGRFCKSGRIAHPPDLQNLAPCQAGKHPDLCSTTRDKPRGDHLMLWIGFWPSVIDPPGQARWSLTAKPRTVI